MCFNVTLSVHPTLYIPTSISSSLFSMSESLNRKVHWALAYISQRVVAWGMFGTTINRNCCVLIRNNHFCRQRSGCRGCAQNLLHISWPQSVLPVAAVWTHWGCTLWLLLGIAAQQGPRKEKARDSIWQSPPWSQLLTRAVYSHQHWA